MGPAAEALDDETILARLLLPMVLEATRVLAEGKVADPRDVDLGVLFGLGFPAARGGLLCWADTLGAAKIIECGGRGKVSARSEPTELLEVPPADRHGTGSPSLGLTQWWHALRNEGRGWAIHDGLRPSACHPTP